MSRAAARTCERDELDIPNHELRAQQVHRPEVTGFAIAFQQDFAPTIAKPDLGLLGEVNIRVRRRRDCVSA